MLNIFKLFFFDTIVHIIFGFGLSGNFIFLIIAANNNDKVGLGGTVLGLVALFISMSLFRSLMKKESN